MSEKTVLIFVCEHGSAKSIVAAAYFNKLARERHLNARALARGTHPDAELTPNTRAGLAADDVPPSESSPQLLTPADLEGAQQIVSFCELPEEIQQSGLPIERWDDVPPVSENYEKARNAILKKLIKLLDS